MPRCVVRLCALDSLRNFTTAIATPSNDDSSCTHGLLCPLSQTYRRQLHYVEIRLFPPGACSTRGRKKRPVINAHTNEPQTHKVAAVDLTTELAAARSCRGSCSAQKAQLTRRREPRPRGNNASRTWKAALLTAREMKRGPARDVSAYSSDCRRNRVIRLVVCKYVVPFSPARALRHLHARMNPIMMRKASWPKRSPGQGQGDMNMHM